MKNVIKNVWRWLRTTGGAVAALMLLGIGLLIWTALPSEVPESPVGPSEPVASTLVPASTTEAVTERSERSDGIVGMDPYDRCINECTDTIHCGRDVENDSACSFACHNDPHQEHTTWGQYCQCVHDPDAPLCKGFVSDDGAAPEAEDSGDLDSPDLRSASGCAGFPFCLAQHGYCKDHCTPAHVCDPSGCNIARHPDGTGLLHTTRDGMRQAVEMYGTVAMREWLTQQNITLVMDENLEAAPVGSCDCSKTSAFCKTLGWPFCCACHQHHSDIEADPAPFDCGSSHDTPYECCRHECADTIHCGSLDKTERACSYACLHDPHQRQGPWSDWCGRVGEFGEPVMCPPQNPLSPAERE